MFLWGTFQFMGLVDSYNETLEFFSASGVPLRSAVSISLTQNRYKISNIPQRTPGQTQPLPASSPIGPALSAAGADPADWRGAALGSGIETPRFSAPGGVNVSTGAERLGRRHRLRRDRSSRSACPPISGPQFLAHFPPAP